MRSALVTIVGTLCVASAAHAQPAEPAPTPALSTPQPPATAAAPAVASAGSGDGETTSPAPPPEPAPAPAAIPRPAVEATAPPASSGISLGGVTISGSLDAYASVNPGRTASNLAPNELYAFETQANGASFSFAKITLERKPAPVGFRLDVGFGSTIDVVNATDAAAGMGHDIMRNLEQAYVSWAVTPSLTLKVGKMVTHHGMEVIESQSNWNYTHSLLFTWGIPFTQTGLAADWVITDKLEATLFLVNGLNNTFEGNGFKSPGLQVVYKATPALTLVQNFSAFNEQPGDAGGLTRFDQAVYLFDTVATYALSDALELAANSDIGIDASLPSGKVYAGIAGYARYHAGKRTSVSVRGEYFHDNESPTLGIILPMRDGIDPPMKGNVVEGTGTFSYAPADGLLLRAEARVDKGLGGYTPFIASSGMPYAASQQVTFILGAVAAF